VNADREFLRSGRKGDGWSLDAESSQFLAELTGRLILDSGHAQAAGSFGIGRDVIDIDRLFGADTAGFEGLAEDEGVGLAGTNNARIDSDGLREVVEEIVGGFHPGDMNGIGVGEKSEAVVFGEGIKELVGVDGGGIKSRVPNVGEGRKIERKAETLGEIEMPVAGRHAAFLPVEPVWIVFDGGPKFFGREVESVGEAQFRLLNIDTDENAADVEDDAAKLGGGSHLLSASGIAGLPAGFQRERRTLMMGGKMETKMIVPMMM